jgi:hypothetical protein
VTTRHGLRRALDLLEQVDAPLIGTVLLGVSSADAYGTDVTYGSLHENGSSNGNGSGDAGFVTQPGSSARRA